MRTDPDRTRSPATSLSGALEESLYTKSLDCVHCGLCLTSCPTYRVSGRENSSPRGRIYLMRGLAEGRLDEKETLAEEAFLCLGCRACETACPSGVQYGEMLELARAAIRNDEANAHWASWVERSVLRWIVPHPKRLSLLVTLLGWIQWIGLDRATIGVLPERIRSMHGLLPKIPNAAQRQRMPSFTPAIGERQGRVALFEGCVMPEFFGRVNEAARLVLSRAGYDVVVPTTQGCCGALQAHSGDLEFARSLARHNVSVFGGEAFDAIVVTSAGCSAAMHDAVHWLGADGEPMAKRTRDVLQFLDEVEVNLAFEPLARRVCYDDPCHLIHAQGIASAPRRLLSRIPGLELVAHRNPEACCGAAGIYNLTHPEMSQAVLSPKLDALIEAAPEIVATANPGCAMQLEAGLAARGHAAEVVHPIELIERASRPTPAAGTRG